MLLPGAQRRTRTRAHAQTNAPRTRCKELKTSRAHLLLYVRGSLTAPSAHLHARSTSTSTSRASTLAEIRATLEELLAAPMQTLDFSATLTAQERANVHQVAAELGLAHFSVGEGAARYVRVAKADAKGLYQGRAGGISPPHEDSMELDDEPHAGEEWGELEAGEAFGLMRMKEKGVGSGVELVLLPYHFTHLMHMISQQVAAGGGAMHKDKQSQAAAAVGFRAEMMDYYRAIPPYYLKPLRAVLRKANASGTVQLPPPEFRETGQESAGKKDGAAQPLVSLHLALKTQLELLKA